MMLKPLLMALRSSMMLSIALAEEAVSVARPATRPPSTARRLSSAEARTTTAARVLRAPAAGATQEGGQGHERNAVLIMKQEQKVKGWGGDSVAQPLAGASNSSQ